MQPTQQPLFPAAQIRQGNVQQQSPYTVQTHYSPFVGQAQQAHHVGQSSFSHYPHSFPASYPSSPGSFPPVNRTSAQPTYIPPQSAFPAYQPVQPRQHQVAPYNLGQDQKPLFPATKERK